MTTQTDIALSIKSALNSLVSNRVYRLTFPQPPSVPVWPSIRYTFISADFEATWCGDAGEQGADHLIQIDVVDLESKGVSAFISLCNSVKSALKSATPQYHLTSQFEAFDEETKTLRMVLEYTVQNSFVN